MNQDNTNMERKQPNWKLIGIIAGICVAVLLVVYIGFSLYFQNHFFFRSNVNGIPASGASAQSMLEKITARADGYELTIVDEDGGKETIVPDDIDMTMEIDKGHLEDLLDGQNGFTWIGRLFSPKDYTMDNMITYDAQKLGEKIQNLACVQNPDVTPTQNATYAYEDQKFVVVDEVYGNQIDQAVLADTLGKAITALEPEVDLSKDNCYVQPTVTADSEELKSAVDTMNDYADVKITYEVGAEKEEIPKDTIASWLMTGDDLQVIFNQDLMSSFVSDMAKKYNTYGQAKTLATSYGKTITVPGGNYGWRIDQAGEVAQLMTDIQAKQDVNRDFVYSVRANSRDANDYGNSYVEINLTAQHLFFYKDGKKVLETDFVSGDPYDGNATHTGAFKITYKDKDAVLRGTNYATPVTFWMPFNGNEGMHDATWRKKFGGNLYKGNGSHGCVNLPYSAAKTIFENVDAGYAVLVYELPGTEQAPDPNQQAADKVITSINNIGNVTLEREGYIGGVRADYNALSSQAKSLVTNYNVLVDAENTINQLKGQAWAAADAQARQQAEAVISQINSAGDAGAVQQARNAYNGLSQAAQAYVNNYNGVNYFDILKQKMRDFEIQ
ncbi:MAG: L,D-transpeptidase family protein [Lachnospiraceae bacterium]